jgi:hypothetical protein
LVSRPAGVRITWQKLTKPCDRCWRGWADRIACDLGSASRERVRDGCSLSGLSQLGKNSFDRNPGRHTTRTQPPSPYRHLRSAPLSPAVQPRPNYDRPSTVLHGGTRVCQIVILPIELIEYIAANGTDPAVIKYDDRIRASSRDQSRRTPVCRRARGRQGQALRAAPKWGRP